MKGARGVFWKRVESFVERAPASSSDKDRFFQFTVFVFLGVPTMVVYGLQNLARGHSVLFSIILASAIGLSAGWYVLGKLKRGDIVYRINASVFGVLLIYMLVIGGEGGSKILWTFTFPMIGFFLLGKWEGALWAGGMFLLAAALMMGAVPGIHVYARRFPDPVPHDLHDRGGRRLLV